MNRRRVVVRGSCAWLIVLISLVIAPVAGQARVSGGCTASATASRSGPVDLTTATVWHVTHPDVINGAASSPSLHKSGQLKMVIFDAVLPLLDPQLTTTPGTPHPSPIPPPSHPPRVP